MILLLMDGLENRMSIESSERPKVNLQEYKKQYMRLRKRGMHNLTIKPATYSKLKGYHDEYIQISAQNFLPVVDFHEFILQYAELGYLNSRSKLKGK